jgi:hypothetical protein
MDANVKRRIEQLAERIRVNAEGAIHHQTDARHVYNSLAMIAEDALTITDHVVRSHGVGGTVQLAGGWGELREGEHYERAAGVLGTFNDQPKEPK